MSVGDKLKPISVNLTLKNHAYDVLRDAILDMNIDQAGVDQRMDERQLGERLAISRTPRGSGSAGREWPGGNSAAQRRVCCA